VHASKFIATMFFFFDTICISTSHFLSALPSKPVTVTVLVMRLIAISSSWPNKCTVHHLLLLDLLCIKLVTYQHVSQ
jgi:hypothetical protein